MSGEAARLRQSRRCAGLAGRHPSGVVLGQVTAGDHETIEALHAYCLADLVVALAEAAQAGNRLAGRAVDGAMVGRRAPFFDNGGFDNGGFYNGGVARRGRLLLGSERQTTTTDAEDKRHAPGDGRAAMASSASHAQMLARAGNIASVGFASLRVRRKFAN